MKATIICPKCGGKARRWSKNDYPLLKFMCMNRAHGVRFMDESGRELKAQDKFEYATGD